MLPFGVGFGEVMLIFVVILLVVGPQKLPEVARIFGKGLRMVRKASDEFQEAVRMDDLRREILDPARQTWRDAQRAGADLLREGDPLKPSEPAKEPSPDEGEDDPGPIPRGATPEEEDDEIEEVVARPRRLDLSLDKGPEPEVDAPEDLKVEGAEPPLKEADPTALAAKLEIKEGDDDLP